ncbi:hypothetical protein TD95_005029 [Thielaviopsis punctulata]|uniref:Microsomal glutathione S-transferase 3 n=1 Tax=Thielaviopsis punctulata TaxID=72032 RepID=A0A0F4ZD21_9PEZI|nr:hypothetical protein TD95_005029 [Thielaviopsis punctulata]
MPLILEVPSEFGYVLAVATSSFFLNTALGIQVGTYRKAAGIKYPTAYASEELAAKDPKAYQFNCAQRAHLNFCEVHISWLGALLISGLRFPTASAAIGATWLVGRALYGRGYVVNGPEGRIRGAIVGFFCDLSLKLMALYSSAMFVLGK